ncbi:hypothetical protein ACHAXR_002732, partial [Thalassiosira sp. AJA248-18]
MFHRKQKIPTALALLSLACCCICGIHSFSLTNNNIKGRTTADCLSSHDNAAAAASHRAIKPSLPFLISDKIRQQNHAGSSSSSVLFMAAGESTTASSPTAAVEEYPPASDGEALQSLFAKYCNDGDGLMTEEEMRSVPAIKEMLEQGDILSSELTEIWVAAPKFPQEDVSDAAVVEKIDVDSFIQVYRDIDDLFEEDGDDEEASAVVVSSDEEVDAAAAVDDPAAAANDDDEMGEDLELNQTFASLSNNGKSISFSELKQWEEITLLIQEEGTLGEDEFVSLWENAVGVKGTMEGDMDLKAFIEFNSALDDLFEFDDDEIASEDSDEAEDVIDEAEEEEPEQPEAAAVPLPVITEEDLPPGVLFSQLANENYLVGKTELQRWGELNGMLKEGDLTMDELNTLFDNAAKAPGTKDMLDEDGFCALFDAIDNLFEDDDEEEVKKPDQKELKEELLEYIEDIAKLAEEEGQLLCGLDCSELEQERVIEVVSELEREPYNQVVALSATGGGAIQKEELVGSWDLIYSSSSTMKYNEGLSGLAGGLTSFGGLQQSLVSTKYISDVEYTEQVVGKLGKKSYDVMITGDWDLRTEVSIFTGKPANIMTVTPDKVSYGPRRDKADHWKSLGPMNLLV